MRQLKNKVVLITGGGRGIGAEVARVFGGQGAKIAVAARSEDELEKTRVDLESHGITAVAIPADVGHLESLRRLVAEVERQLGPVDVLVNNAGIEEIMEFEKAAFEEIEHTFRVNVIGLEWLTRLVLPSGSGR